jgi:hypothetical protein
VKALLRNGCVYLLIKICSLAADVLLFVSRSLPSNGSTRYNIYNSSSLTRSRQHLRGTFLEAVCLTAQRHGATLLRCEPSFSRSPTPVCLVDLKRFCNKLYKEVRKSLIGNESRAIYILFHSSTVSQSGSRGTSGDCESFFWEPPRVPVA